MIKNYLQMEVELLLNRVKQVNDKTCVTSTLFVGEKGAGKTHLTETIGRLFCGPNWKPNYLFYQCHEGTTPAHFLYDIDVQGVVDAVGGNVNAMYLEQYVALAVKAQMDGELEKEKNAVQKIQEYTGKTPSTLSKGILVQAIEKSITGKVILVVDEFDKTPRAIDAFFLDFLQNFRINDPIHGNIQGNKANAIVVFTSNDERLFSDPLYRRVVTVHVEYPDEQELFKRLKTNVKTQFSDTLLLEIIKFVNKVREIKDLFYTPVLSEIMTLVVDLEQLTSRTEDELAYFITRTLSPEQEDRKKIMANDSLKKFIKKFIELKPKEIKPINIPIFIK